MSKKEDKIVQQILELIVKECSKTLKFEFAKVEIEQQLSLSNVKNMAEIWAEVLQQLEELGYTVNKSNDVYVVYNYNFGEYIDETIIDEPIISDSTLGSQDSILKEVNDILNTIEHTNTSLRAKKASTIVKTLIISDLHIPFELVGLDTLIGSLSEQFDNLVINGDFLDMFSMSTFSKDADIPLYAEVERGMAYLSKWSKQFDKLIFNKGNHEMRAEREFGKNDKFNRIMFMNNFDVLDYIVSGLKYADFNEKAGAGTHMDDIDDFMSRITYTKSTACKIGDAIIAHPTTYSAVPSKTVSMAIDYYKERIPNIKAVIIGHTHHVAKIMFKDVIGIESGSLCGTLPYENQGGIKMRTQENGIVFLVQKDGITDPNATMFFSLDSFVKKQMHIKEVEV